MPIDNQRRAADHEGPESEVPGGAGLNRAATVVTSAALGAAISGALVGSVAGPVGAAVGAAVGALAAGIGGNAIAESVDADAEAAYWRNNYRDRPYVDPAASFDDYGPAFSHGVANFVKHRDRPFEDVEADLSLEWGTARGPSTLEWERAREASLDGWVRARDGQPR